MSRKSVQRTPRSSAKQQTPRKVSHDTRRTPKTARIPENSGTNFKKIIGHRMYDTHYVEYEVELTNGQKKKATEFDFKGNSEMLSSYKNEVTNQTDDSNGEYLVDRIITHRMVDRKPLYLVSWKGYPHPIWNSELWESDLQNCKKILAAYKEANHSSDCSKTPKPTPSRAPKSTATRKRNLSPEEEVPKAAVKKTKQSSPNRKKEEELIQRDEEIQESDDDDEELSTPTASAPAVTTTAPAATQSRWGFGSWKWF